MKASIYNASAGSGKTYRLAYKYIRDVIESPTLYRNILAVTFTNKATEEMKRRILKHIHNLASGLPCDYLAELMAELNLSSDAIRARAVEARTLILHNYSRFTVLTIDKFFQRVLRAFIQELGIDIDYSLEIDTSPIITQSADALVEDESLRKWLMELAQERIDEGRKWDVREGILALKDELFKEEARSALESSRTKEELSEMVGKMEIEATAIVEKIRSLAQEAMERISGDCSQFKGGSRSPAHVFRRIVECDRELPELTDAQIASRNDIDKWCKKGDNTTLATEMMQRLDQIVEIYLTGIKRINTAKLLSENYRSFALMHDLYQKTQEICQEQNTMLLSQTSRILSEFIEENDAPFIYEKVGNRYSRFMIDEFQDTSRREWNNFTPLLRDAIAQSRPDENPILIVGDIKQSIYRWRGGDWRILHSDAERELGQKNSEVINMVDNYRSLPNIVRFNNEMIESIITAENEELNRELSSAYDSNKINEQCKNELTGIIRSAYTDHEQNPRRGGDAEGFVELSTYTEEPPIIETICSAIDRGYRPCDIMILTRSNREASMVAERMLRFKQECDEPRYRFDVMTQEALIVGKSPVSNFIVATLHLSLNPDDTLQRAIYNRFVESSLIDTELTDEEGEFVHSLRMLSPLEAMEMIVMRYDLSSQPTNIAYVQAIHEQIITYTKNKIGDIALFLEWWHEKGAKQSLRVEKSTNAIEILTIHKAKGLEKSVVILPYCNWDRNPKSSGVNKNFVWSEGDANSESDNIGKFPIQYKARMEESAFSADFYRERVYTRIDNINTLYVALTRAVESLHIFVKATAKGVGSGIGKVVLESIPTLSIGSVDQGESGVKYTLSQPSSPSREGDDEGGEPFIMQHYRSNQSQLRLRLPTQRYRESAAEEFSPREVGILMHRAFEQSTSRQEILQRVETMLSNGHINENEHRTLVDAIGESLSHPLAQEWFDTEWESVRNESEIIRPNSESSRRPDRVMIRGSRAVVVDYKFGELQSEKNRRQMRQYVSLLREMGYSEVEGYVWYVRSNEIERIEG
ncbi:MAG: UvrD-helicase domain-containing protein [Rikenellaceae bacterium]